MSKKYRLFKKRLDKAFGTALNILIPADFGGDLFVCHRHKTTLLFRYGHNRTQLDQHTNKGTQENRPFVSIFDEGAWLRILREGRTTTFEEWGKDTKWNTSLFHLTMSYAAVFMADTDLGKMFE